MMARDTTPELRAAYVNGDFPMPNITPDTALVWLQTGEQITQFIVRDVVAFRAWLASNTSEADTQQLKANDRDYAAAIIHERAIAAGDGTGVR